MSASASQDVRVRRPHEHEVLLRVLQEDVGFPALRDILIFAAAVGAHAGRCSKFTATGGDAIRYEVLSNPMFADALVCMIAASVSGEDAEIMDESRLQERVALFEEYANGGLNLIQETMNTRGQSAASVVADLVVKALRGRDELREPSVEELLDGIDWS